MAEAKREPWWSKGVQFECQGSGNCCTSRGEFGYVYLTLADQRRMASHFKLNLSQFRKQHCEKTDGLYYLREEKGQVDCKFLEERKCSIYPARPTQCRTWPFWPEVMGAKEWKKEVASFCPGVGKGRVHTKQEIERALKEQRASDKKLKIVFD